MDPETDAPQLTAAAGDLADREAAYEKLVWDNLPRNYAGNYLHGMLGMTGFRLLNAPTFLPAYLQAISGSSAIVGLGLALQQVGGVISPIFAATRMEHRKIILPVAVTMGGIGRLTILGMALAGWFLKGQSLAVALIACMFLFGLFMGVQKVAFSLLISKVIPLRRRGRLQAWRNATGGAIAAVMAYLAGKYIIGPDLFGNGYSTTFLMAFILTSAGLLAVRFLVREPETPKTRSPARFRDRLREFPNLFAQNPAYGSFVLVQMLSTTARMATPFFIIHLGTPIELDGATLGLLSLAFLGADTLANLVWGYLGDQTGFKLVFATALTIWIGATILLMFSEAMPLVFLGFCG